MTNDELKKKICEIIDSSCSFYCGSNVHMDDEQENAIADALIAAGIGDVKDLQAQVDSLEITNIALQAGYDDAENDRLYWVDKYKEAEHRAEVAEKIVGKALSLLSGTSFEEIFGCSSCPVKDKCNAKCTNECANLWKNYLTNQAEKELAEEWKDEQI